MTRPDESGVESDNGSRGRIQSAAVRTRIASQRHVSLAVPFRAAERNRRVASSVLAGGVACRLFLWLLPFSFSSAACSASAMRRHRGGGRRRRPCRKPSSPQTGRRSRRGDELVVAPLARRVAPPVGGIYGSEGAAAFTRSSGARRLRRSSPSRARSSSAQRPRVHSQSLVHVRDETELEQLLTAAVMVFPLAELWLWVSSCYRMGKRAGRRSSRGHCSRRSASRCCTGPSSTSLGTSSRSRPPCRTLGIVTTLLFFMYLVGRIVVTAPILNSALHEELRGQSADPDGAPGTPPAAPSSSRGESTVHPRPLGRRAPAPSARSPRGEPRSPR